MNPGYAGRSELPDNLKALFRTVAVMVPDYAMIAEIMLYSYGFNSARILARKIVTTYKLCSEQLSSQSHYDYGMRAVKSVITAAGNLKRRLPNDDENILLLRSINDVNLAKFLAIDLPLFKGITSDLFPNTKIPEIDYSALNGAIDIQLKQMNLVDHPYFHEKIIQFYEIILVRHGVMIVGGAFSGKTTILKVLSGALGELNKKGLMGENKVQYIIINPKAITMKQLYGAADEVTNEWSDGVLAVKFRFLAKDETDDRKWLIFDGPVDAVWIESMNTVLDDSKRLCLTSGEVIAMARNMNMIFEPMDLLVASPATVSRCGMVYIEPDEIGWNPIYQSWKNHLPKTFKEEDIAEVNFLFTWALNEILSFIRKHCQEISPTQNQNLVQALMRIYRTFLKDMEDEAYYNSLEMKNKMNILDNFFVFSVVWSLGASVSTEHRKPLDAHLKKIFLGDIQIGEMKKKKINIPEKSLLFDWVYELKSNKLDGDWKQWIEKISLEEIPKKMAVQNIIISTVDTVRYSYLLKLNILNDVT